MRYQGFFLIALGTRLSINNNSFYDETIDEIAVFTNLKIPEHFKYNGQ